MLAGVPLALFLLLPLAALLFRGATPMAWRQLSDPAAIDAIWLSLKTTCVATALVAILGVPLAFWLSRRTTPLRRALEAVLVMPIALPPAAAGVALLLAYGRQGMVNLSVSFTTTAVILAQAFVSAPFFLRAAVNAFGDQAPQMFQVAETDGASSWAMMTRIAVPVGARALFAGAAITWARAAGEFGATIIFAGNFPGTTQTMPLAIYLGFESNFDLAVALAVLLLALAMVAVVGAHLLMRLETKVE